MSSGDSGKTAFVFAGGGSFGAVQVGMLRELVAAGVRADLVVGCSVGAINGVHFAGAPDANGVSKLEQIWRALRRHDIFPFSIGSVFAALARKVVLPGGFACALAAPPSGAVASAMHALNLMIARQMTADVERIGAGIEIAVIPPLCPLDVSPYDFTRAGELIDRAAKATREWLVEGGLARRGIPHQLREHVHK